MVQIAIQIVNYTYILNTKPDLLMKFGQPITEVLEVLDFCKQSPYKVLTHVILHRFTNPLWEEMTK